MKTFNHQNTNQNMMMMVGCVNMCMMCMMNMAYLRMRRII